MDKSVTIYDIAKKANVSSATVSRVLSNSDYPVSKPLQEKIQRIAEEMNYIPNMLGKQLKTNSSTTIGVIIPTINNPFYSSVIFGIEEIAREHQFTVVVCNSLQDPGLEQEYIRTIVQKQIKGLIISSISDQKAQIKKLVDFGISVIAIDQKIEDEEISQVEFNYSKAGYMATKYLQSKGHRRIGYVTSKLDRPSRKNIYKGYMKAMKEANLELIVEESKAEELYSSMYEFDLGKRLTQKLLDSSQLPTAIFACNDMMAIGVINELWQQGFRVPEDISVMGFDGIDFGQMINPALTSIKQPDYEMGKLSCKMLIDMMDGKDSPMFDIMLQPKLLERNSIREICSE